MPILNGVKRRLTEHFATLVNELHIGSDGTKPRQTTVARAHSLR